MPVLGAEVARSVAVAVLSIHVSSLLKKCVDHVIVAANAGHMQRSTHCLCTAVQVATELSEDFDQVDMAFV